VSVETLNTLYFYSIPHSFGLSNIKYVLMVYDTKAINITTFYKIIMIHFDNEIELVI